MLLPICDQEQDPDRWCSHCACGQEAWHIISQWVWNLRLELGHLLAPDPVRTTEFASRALVSVLLHPLIVGSAPLLWRDWSRRHHRRACRQLLRYHRVEVQVDQGLPAHSALAPAPLSRAQRAHYRLDFQERLARNARVSTASRVTIRLFGIPEGFATSLGLATAYHCLDSCWILSSRTGLLLRVEPHGFFP